MSHTEVVELVKAGGYRRLDEPVKLASGQWSRDFVDGKAAVASGKGLQLVCREMVNAHRDIAFDAVGGLTMGADAYAVGIAIHCGCDWFFVRKEPKGRGTNQLIEGAQIHGRRVLLVDDVVSTGGSIQTAYERVQDAGGIVVAAVTLVDRGDVAQQYFDDRNIPFVALVTYRDLGIEPVGPALVVH